MKQVARNVFFKRRLVKDASLWMRQKLHALVFIPNKKGGAESYITLPRNKCVFVCPRC